MQNWLWRDAQRQRGCAASCRGSGCTAQPHAAASGVQLVSNLHSDKLLGTSCSAGRGDGEQVGSAEVKWVVFGKWSEFSFTLSNEWRLRGDTQGPGRGRVQPAGGAELSRPRPAPGVLRAGLLPGRDGGPASNTGVAQPDLTARTSLTAGPAR